MTRSLVAALRRRCGVREGDHLLVAVSGGADSVALLRALTALAPRRRWRLALTVAHVQHHLRPADLAEGDAAFVSELADALALPFLRADLDLSRETENREAAARRARYEALSRLAAIAGCPFVATGHHADDQLETLLMRILRGTGAAGMRGIAWKRPLTTGGPVRLIRPMLGVDHAQAVSYLQSIHQPWREDHTNFDLSRWRARLRRDVLPVLRELRPDAAARATELARHMAALDHLVRRQAGELERIARRSDSSTNPIALDRATLRAAPRIVTIALLRRILTRHGAPPDALGARTHGPILRAIRDTQGGERRFTLAGGLTLQITREDVGLLI